MLGPRPAASGRPLRGSRFVIRTMLIAFLVVAALFNIRVLTAFQSGAAVDLSALGRDASAALEAPSASALPAPVPQEVAPPVSEVLPEVRAPDVEARDPNAVTKWFQQTGEQVPALVPPVKRVRPRVRRVEIEPSVSPSPAAAPVVAAGPSLDTSSLSAFVAAGGNIPILVVTRSRTDVLRQTLSSLLSVRGVSREAVFVVQDGNDAACQEVIASFGLRYHQKEDSGPALRGNAQDVGAQRIAIHFKYALEYMFDTVTDAPGIIIVEDDFLFSADFYEYFHFVAPALDRDPSLFVASAWNDNGFVGIAKDRNVLRRTSYFPGLGWLLPRKLYTQELRAKWPKKHWDHWLRDPKQHQNRDIIIPEVPRVFHAGVKGTFMDQKTHNQYFARVATNLDDKFHWRTDAGEVALRNLQGDVYKDSMRTEIKNAVVLTNVEEMNAFTSGVGVVWYTHSQRPVAYKANTFRHMAAYFGIWHEPVRGARDGVHRIHWLGDALVYLVNTHTCRELSDMMPASRVNPLMFQGTSSPIPLTHEAGVDPMALLQGTVQPPLPAVSPASPLMRIAAMK